MDTTPSWEKMAGRAERANGRERMLEEYQRQMIDEQKRRAELAIYGTSSVRIANISLDDMGKTTTFTTTDGIGYRPFAAETYPQYRYPNGETGCGCKECQLRMKNLDRKNNVGGAYCLSCNATILNADGSDFDDHTPGCSWVSAKAEVEFARQETEKAISARDKVIEELKKDLALARGESLSPRIMRPRISA